MYSYLDIELHFKIPRNFSTHLLIPSINAVCPIFTLLSTTNTLLDFSSITDVSIRDTLEQLVNLDSESLKDTFIRF